MVKTLETFENQQKSSKTHDTLEDHQQKVMETLDTLENQQTK